jgi:thioredoxin reductase (NADPH)
MLGTLLNTGWLENFLQLDEKGFVITGPEVKAAWFWSRLVMMLETSVPGVFGASDVRVGSVRQMASAVGEGTMAVSQVHQVLADGISSGNPANPGWIFNCRSLKSSNTYFTTIYSRSAR